MRELEGRTAVVTGGASGIGFALARRFGEAGMKVVIADVDAGALDGAVRRLADDGITATPVVCDVALRDQVEALRDAALDAHGAVHLLCNNAGVGAGGPVIGGDRAGWEWVIEVDLWGVINGCQVFGPALLAHGEPAHIVNTASMAGLLALPGMGAYCVAKFGVVALSEALWYEQRAAGTRLGVSVVAPGFVRTRIHDSERVRPERHPRPELDPQREAERELGAQVVRELVESGIDPAEVARAVHDAVVEDRFWVLTHPEMLERVEARTRAILQGTDPPPLDPGVPG